MRYLLGLLALVGLMGMEAQALTRQQTENVQKMTVLVTNEGLLGGGRGTGVLIDENHVLTCAHMVESPLDELFIYTYPFGQVVKAHGEYIDRSKDLVLLVLESSTTLHVKPVFQNDFYAGEPITVVGNTLGAMSWIVSHGVISGMERRDLLTDALVNPGNSGGPWVNDKGEIVALTDWRIGPMPHVPGIAGGISAKNINSFFSAIEGARMTEQILAEVLKGGKRK